MKVVPDSIAIAYVHPNTVTERFGYSLAQACLNRGNPIAALISTSNPRQALARNTAIERFLEGPCEWLMWIDTDMVFDYDAPVRLLRTAKREKADAVTGLGFIFKRQDNIVVPNGYMWDEEENAFAEIKDYKSGVTYEVDGTGAGFVLINRSVFERWGDSHWHHTWAKHPVTGSDMGHDLAFFYRMTQELGLKLVWDTSVTTGHVKHFELNEDSFRQFQGMQ